VGDVHGIAITPVLVQQVVVMDGVPQNPLLIPVRKHSIVAVRMNVEMSIRMRGAKLVTNQMIVAVLLLVGRATILRTQAPIVPKNFNVLVVLIVGIQNMVLS